MGGLEPAGPYVLDLLAARQARRDREQAARRTPRRRSSSPRPRPRGVQLRFEASVCAAIPVIKVLREALVVTNVHRVLGIVNGTTNFVLTEMEGGTTYAEALADAQARGYAEADPTDDVSGADAAAKMAILATVAFNTRVALDDVDHTGITELDPLDVAAARELEMVVRLVGAARLVDGAYDVRVEPAFVDAPASAGQGRRRVQRGDAAGRRDPRDHARRPGRRAAPRRRRRSSPTSRACSGRWAPASCRTTPSGASCRGCRPASRARRSTSGFFVEDRPGTLAHVAEVPRPARGLGRPARPAPGRERRDPPRRHARSGCGRAARTRSTELGGCRRSDGARGRSRWSPTAASPSSVGRDRRSRDVAVARRGRYAARAAPRLSADARARPASEVRAPEPDRELQGPRHGGRRRARGRPRRRGRSCARRPGTPPRRRRRTRRAPGLHAVVLTPEGATASAKRAQAHAAGARVLEVRGTFDDALRLCRELGEQDGFVLVNSLNPDRIDGQRSVVGEIVEQLGGVPDVIALPYGGGGNVTRRRRRLRRGRDRAGARRRRGGGAPDDVRVGDPHRRAGAPRARRAAARRRQAHCMSSSRRTSSRAAWSRARAARGRLLRAGVGGRGRRAGEARRPRGRAPCASSPATG